MDHVSNDRGLVMFLLTVSLHLLCVLSGKASIFIPLAIAGHFGLDTAISMVSGIGSIATAMVLVKHYILRNKLLRKELKEKMKEEKEAAPDLSSGEEA